MKPGTEKRPPFVGGMNWRLIAMLAISVWLFLVEIPLRSWAQPSTPGFVSRASWPPFAIGNPSDIFVLNGKAYVTTQQRGLVIFDVTDPIKPIMLGGCDTGDGARAVHVAGNFAYVMTSVPSGMQIFDVSDPARATLVGNYLASHDPLTDVEVVGNLAYLACNDGLKILDISNPAQPILIGTITAIGRGFRVQVAGTKVNMATSTGLHIIDVSNPASPTRLGGLSSSSNCGSTDCPIREFQVVGNVGYTVETRGLKLQIYDVTNPAGFVPLGSYNWGPFGNASDLQVVGNLAYTAKPAEGFVVFDVSNPTDVKEIGRYVGGLAGRIQVINDLAYAADSGGLQILDVSNPGSWTGPISTYDAISSVNEIVVSGGMAYVTGRDSGLEIIDFSNPVAPVRVGGYSAGGETYGSVQLSGKTVYTSVSSSAAAFTGLRIVDVSNPSSPVLLGSIVTSGSVYDAHVVGSRAYIAVGAQGLEIFDLSNLATPVRLGGYATGGYAKSVQVVENFAYVTSDFFGLRIIDVRNPTSPLLVGGYDSIMDGVWLEGSRIYLAHRSVGLLIFDASNPAAPVRLGSYPSGGGGVHVLGNVAHVTEGDSGLRVIDVSNPAAPVLRTTYSVSRTLTPARSVCVEGSLAYVGFSGIGIVVFDLTKPPGPTRIGERTAPVRLFASSNLDTGRFRLVLSGVGGTPTVLQASSNLVNWIPVWTNATIGSIEFIDPEEVSRHAMRFYRARQ